MEQLVLVRAEKDAVLTVPSDASEDDTSVAALCDGYIYSVKLLNVEAPGVDEVLTAPITLTFINGGTFLPIEELEGG